MTNQPYPGATPPPLPENRAPDPNQQAGWNQQYSQQQQYGQQPPPPPPQYRQPPSRQGTGSVFFSSCLAAGCATLLAPLLLLAGLVFIVASLASVDFSGSGSASFSGVSGDFREKLLRKGEAGRGTIAVISVRGEINGNGSELDGSGTLVHVADQLRAAAKDDEVKAVILQVDSPGGGLTPSDILYNEVMKVRGEGKIVVAWAGSLMASGGYYIAAAADGIMASPTASIGSIGVIMQRFQVDGLMKMLGLKFDPIMAGSSKDMGSPFRELTPEERAVFQESVDHAHNRFIGIVAKGRGMARDEVEKLADGKLYTADASVANGLVDRIGYIDQAVTWTEELTGEEDMRIVSYRRVFSFSDIWSDSSRGLAILFDRLLARTTAHPRLAAEWTGE